MLFLCHLSRSLSQSPSCKLCSENHCRSSISLYLCSADSNLDSSLQLNTPNRHFHCRAIHSHNLPNRANSSHLASPPSNHSPNHATIHRASPPHGQQIPTNRQVRQGNSSLLEHVATHRIQGQKQVCEGCDTMDQAPSDDAPAIEGMGPSCDPISNNDHSNHGTAPFTSDHGARATIFPFPLLLFACLFSPPFSLPSSPLPFPCSFTFPFSLFFPLPCPFPCQDPCQQLQTLSHLNLSKQY